jgi:hypothetical protein
VKLRDMMARWADQDDKENDRFPKRNHDKQGNGNSHFDKSQRNHSGNTQKRKPDHEVAAVECNPRGKKVGEQPLGIRASHAQAMPDTPEIAAHTLQVRHHPQITQRTLLHQAGKRKDKEDDEGGDKSGAQDFQDPKNVINIIFGGDSGFPSKRA